MEQNPEDIPKEELLQLCMKLNKRMQAMETKGKEIFKKKNTLQLERQKLLNLLESVVLQPLQPNPSDADLDFNLIESVWNNWNTSRQGQTSAYLPESNQFNNEAPAEVDLLNLNELDSPKPSDNNDGIQVNIFVSNQLNSSVIVTLVFALCNRHFMMITRPCKPSCSKQSPKLIE